MSAGVDAAGAAIDERDTIREIPSGKIAIWWFLASEIMVFGALMGCYILFSFAHGGFAADGAHVKWRLGAFNTLVLVTSSLTMIMALASARAHNLSRTRLFLLATVLLGITFLCVKGFEYTTEIHEGFTPSTSIFWSFYFGMTGLHGLHVIGGIVVNTILLIAALSRKPWNILERRIEFAGLYWHFVDVVWIFLFPLLYLT
ncbi:MAG: heme-copper oxidase subunit III [Candidatus Binataceae bacterium]